MLAKPTPRSVNLGSDRFAMFNKERDIPQAKGGKDKLGVVQAKQDIAWCEQKYPGIRCRAISAQFMTDNRIALFELTVESDMIKVVEEKHYKLLPSSKLDQKAIRDYR